MYRLTKENVLCGPKAAMGDLVGLGEKCYKKMCEFGDNVALINAEDGSTETFSSLRSRAVAVCLALRRHGVAYGDLVSIIELTHIDTFVIAIGVLMSGATLSLLDAGVTAATVTPGQLINIKPKIVFCHYSAEQLADKVIKENKLNTRIITYAGASKCNHETLEKFVETFSNGKNDDFRPTKIEDAAHSAAIILCTSGSTGQPKGVLISHGGLYQLISSLKGRDLQGVTIFTNSGLYWGTGIYMLLTGLLGGAKRVYTTKSFTEENVLRIIEEYKPAVALLSCFQISLLNNYPGIEDKDLTSMKILLGIGSKLSSSCVKMMSKRLIAGKLVICYGLTECMGATSTMSCAEYRPGSVGYMSLNSEIKIVDETGKALGAGQAGEIYLRGATMLGYYDNEEATREVLDTATGWLRTGDLGYFDSDGYVYITGRIKEIAKYKGLSVIPNDIEEVILLQQNIKSAAVVTLPHDDLCDLIVAFVELVPGAQDTNAKELEDRINGTLQDHLKIRGGLYIVDKLPILNQGKIDKIKVKKMALDMSDEIYKNVKINNVV